MRRRYNGLDKLKGLCSFLVVCIHAPFPGEIGNYFTTLTRIAVPVFFMITGFFYRSIVENGKEMNQMKNTLWLFLRANLLYLICNMIYATICGEGALNYVSTTITFRSFLKFILLNDSPFGGHLWYLGALLYTLIIANIAQKLNLMKVLMFAQIFLIGDLFLGKYSILLWEKEYPYILVRNFLFVGIPYFCIGFLLSQKEKIVVSWDRKKIFFLIILFSGTSILERWLLVSKHANATRDHYISTTFLTIFMFLFFLGDNQKDANKAGNIIGIIGKKYSSHIYLLHPIVITTNRAIAQGMGAENVYRFIAPIMVYGVTLLLVSVLFKNVAWIKQRRNL